MLDKAGKMAADTYENEVVGFRKHIQNVRDAELAIEASTRAEAEEEAELKRMLKAWSAAQKVTKASPLAKEERAHGGSQRTTQFIHRQLETFSAAFPTFSRFAAEVYVLDAIRRDANGHKEFFDGVEGFNFKYSLDSGEPKLLTAKHVRSRIAAWCRKSKANMSAVIQA
jgi:hypothetical protein